MSTSPRAIQSVLPADPRSDRRDGLAIELRAASGFETPIDVRTAARFLGVSASLVYAYVERKQIPHFRMMGRTIRFRLSELEAWRQRFHVSGESK